MNWARLLVIWVLVSSSPAYALSGDYDHSVHGFELDGRHAQLECSACHTRGVFANTPRLCVGCHEDSGRYTATFRSPLHPPTTQNCEACHLTTNWSNVPQINHWETIGSCKGCHNSTFADGLPPSHTPTNAECNACHIDLAWAPTQFDHSDITADCHGCHNGIDATGKHAAHIASSNACDDCHTTVGWLPAVFDHAMVTPGTCSSCHDGMTATGKHPPHVRTNAECDVCHSSVAWQPAIFDHADVTPGTCSGCHDGVTATGTNPGHFQSALECDVCHGSVAWLPDLFDHTSPSYPGDHGGNLGCVDCHLTNADVVSYPNAAYQPDCAGCHANDFRNGPHKKFENPDTTYSVAELRDCTGACHVYTDATLSNIKEFRPGPEHRAPRREW